MDATKLEALADTTAAIDAEIIGGLTPDEQAAQDAADEETAAEDNARQWGMIAYTIGGALGMLCPELRKVYTDDACMTWGRAVVPVADKYGWGEPANIPEFGLAIATLGLAVPSVLAVRERLRQLKADRASAAPAAASIDANGTAGGTDGQ